MFGCISLAWCNPQHLILEGQLLFDSAQDEEILCLLLAGVVDSDSRPLRCQKVAFPNSK